MAHEPSRLDAPSSAAGKHLSPELLKLGEAQTEAMLDMQRELLRAYEQISGAWLARVKTEAEFWSELATRISTSRSVSDALGAYQECLARRLQMAADDGRQLAEDSQKIMNTITRALSNGCSTGSMRK